MGGGGREKPEWITGDVDRPLKSRWCAICVVWRCLAHVSHACALHSSQRSAAACSSTFGPTKLLHATVYWSFRFSASWVYPWLPTNAYWGSGLKGEGTEDAVWNRSGAKDEYTCTQYSAYLTDLRQVLWVYYVLDTLSTNQSGSRNVLRSSRIFQSSHMEPTSVTDADIWGCWHMSDKTQKDCSQQQKIYKEAIVVSHKMHRV